MNVLRYAIFVRERDNGDGIVVWRVLHGARDLPKLVKPPNGASYGTPGPITRSCGMRAGQLESAP